MHVRVGDTRLFFDVEGASLVPEGPSMRQRPTVILLHGGPGTGDHSDFKPWLSPLADCAQVVHFDHRGTGRGDLSDPASWNLQTWAAHLRGFCDALEIERPVILGHSFGGFVALRYAIDYPHHPSKLILAVTAAHINLERICEATARLGGEAARTAVQRFLTDPTAENMETFMEICGPIISVQPPDPDLTARVIVRPEVTRHFFRHEGLTFDHRDGAARVKCRALVVICAQDFIAPVEAGLEPRQSLPSELVEFVTIENAGHDWLLDQPEQTLEVVRRFITA